MTVESGPLRVAPHVRVFSDVVGVDSHRYNAIDNLNGVKRGRAEGGFCNVDFTVEALLNVFKLVPKKASVACMCEFDRFGWIGFVHFDR